MWKHIDIEQTDLRQKLKRGEIRFAGNRQLKIYGTLTCHSGKRMMKMNRVFFTDESEALMQGYRPCGHCMKTVYKKWKNAII